MRCVHFIGFDPIKEPMRLVAAIKVFGPPDFVHRIWDTRAAVDIAEDDLVVFAEGSEKDTPSFYPYNEDEYYSRLMQRFMMV